MERTIMILGAGTMQLPAIKAAKAMGLKTVVVDRYNDVVGASLADYFYPIDIKNREALLDCAKNFARLHRLDAIFTAGTDFSANVAYIANEMGLAGHCYEAALNATDKVRMRQCFAKQGLLSPCFIDVTKKSNIDELCVEIKSWTGGLIDAVVKPVDSMGARGVIRVCSRDMLDDAISHAMSYSQSQRVIVEEYIDGPEFSIDALVVDGWVTVVGIADRHICFPPAFIEMGHNLPSLADKETLKMLVDSFVKGVRALGLTLGAAKGDMKMTTRGAVIGEIAARLSGGYMSGWTLPYATGIDITTEAIRLALGEKKIYVSKKSKKFSVEKAFLSIPGKIASINGLELVKDDSYIKELFVGIKIGDTVVFPRNNTEKCGNIIAVAPTFEEATRSANKAVKKIFIRLQAGYDVTNNFLFGEENHQVAFINGRDFSGYSREQAINSYERITQEDTLSYKGLKRDQFNKALDRGGLQGAVWFFDSI